MKINNFRQNIEEIIETISVLIAKYMEDPIDNQISGGNVALCIIDEVGNVYGRLFGSDKIRSRRAYLVAWTKASQVWITGIATGTFEKKVFNGEINDKDFGIIKPDFIGWEGGQPVQLKDGTKLSVGFSGFRGIMDVQIVKEALQIIENK